MNAAERQLKEARQVLGDDVLILAHHYQRDEIVQHADHVGDSLELARRAADATAAQIVFCGVTFMAETASVLARPGQVVYAPRDEAGCFLADQAEHSDVLHAWASLGEVMDTETEVLPVAYVNTSVEVKAVAGAHGGMCCTSSNAERIVSAALAKRPRVLFLPDHHLGYNVARRLGLPEECIALWDPHEVPEDASAYRDARLILWRGACNVHARLLPQDVARVRRERPHAAVLVHPECRPDVAALADEVGSTSLMVRRVRDAAAGDAFAIGTEQRLVARLAREYPNKQVYPLADPPPFCATMSMTRLRDLVRLLSELAGGGQPAPTHVPETTARRARLALQRMLARTE